MESSLDEIDQETSVSIYPRLRSSKTDRVWLAANEGLLVVCLAGEYRLIGWDVETQAMLFDKKPSRNGLGNLAFCILETRRLIAIG